MSRGNLTGVLGPVKPICYPLSGGGGTLLFIVTACLLRWAMYILFWVPHGHSQSVDSRQTKTLRGKAGMSVYPSAYACPTLV